MNTIRQDFQSSPWLKYQSVPDFTHGIRALFFDCAVIVKPIPTLDHDRLFPDDATRLLADRRQPIEEEPDLVPGARDYLETHFGRHDSFLISSAEQTSLDNLCHHHRLSHYFRQIAGGPRKKLKWIKQLLHAFRIDPDRAVYVACAAVDHAIAAQAGMRFIGVGEAFEEGEYPGTPIIPDLHGLDVALAELPLAEEFLV